MKTAEKNGGGRGVKPSSDFDLDDVLVELGHAGKFQIRNYLLLTITIIFSAFFTINYVFTTSNPAYRCYIPECESETSNGDVTFAPSWLENAVPTGADNLPSRCFRYHYIARNNSNDFKCTLDNFNHSWTEKCDKFVFKPQITTIANDFNIYCDDNLWKLTLPGTIHNIGEFVSMPLTGIFSDRFGRRAALVWGLFFSAIFGLIRSFSPKYVMFVVFEFLDATVGAAAYASAFILGTELVAPSRRVLVGTFVCGAYAIGEAIIGLVAWNVDTWRELIRYTYAPGLLILVYFWLVPESVRWLISKERYEDVEKTLQKAAKINDITFSQQTLDKLEALKTQVPSEGEKTEEPVEENQQTLWKAFTNLPMALRIINCSICWVTCVFVFYGLSLNSVEIAGNMYLNFIAVSLIEIPGYIISYFLLNYLGRRTSLSGSFICSGIACFAFIFISDDLATLKLIAYLFGKCSITVAFTVIYVLTAEIFPTPLRHSLMGICSMIGRIGSIIAPQMPLLAAIWPSLPLLLFGLMSVISGLLSLLFPETLNTKLPDTIDEALHIVKNKSEP